MLFKKKKKKVTLAQKDNILSQNMFIYKSQIIRTYFSIFDHMSL